MTARTKRAAIGGLVLSAAGASHGREDGSFDVPPPLNAGINSLVVDPGNFCPLHGGFALAATNQEFVTPLVSSLRLAIRPPAVLRGIVAVRVNPVYGVPARRRRPHILDECRKTAFPARAYPYSTPSVQIEIWGCLQQTPLFHQPPGVVFLGCPTPIRVSGLTVQKICLRRPFSLKTSAGLRVSGAQFVGGHITHGPAIAQAAPSHTLCRFLRSDSRKKSPKAEPSQINESGHTCLQATE